MPYTGKLRVVLLLTFGAKRPGNASAATVMSSEDRTPAPSTLDSHVVSLAVLGDANPRWRPHRFDWGRWGSQAGISFPVVRLLDFAVQRRAAELYRRCEEAVNAEVARGLCGPSADIAGNHDDNAEASTNVADGGHGHDCGEDGNGSRPHGGHGNGRAPSFLSPRQEEYIERLANQIPGLGVLRLEQFVATAFAKPLAELTYVEASRLIETLQDVTAGELDLENAAALVS